jgi:hypothetical protein
MRGRLHHTFLAEFVQIDAAQTRTQDPDDVGDTLSGGFDDDFDEIFVFTKADGSRVSAKQEQPPVFLACNVETESWQALQQMMAGNAPNTQVVIVVHRRSLEELQLFDPKTGDTLIRVNDKLVSLRDSCRCVLARPRRPWYVTQIAPSFGIGTTPDLYSFTIEDREDFSRA